MYKLPGADRSDYQGETSWEIGGSTGPSENVKLIYEANSVPLIDIFEYYGIPLDKYNKKTVCPLPNHNEKSASFYYYDDTNSFWCFGCHAGVKPIDFVVEMEGVSRIQAAKKILKSFSGGSIELTDHYKPFIKIIEFSNKIREFRMTNLKSEAYIENICSAFDKINIKHDLNNAGIEHLITKLEKMLNE